MTGPAFGYKNRPPSKPLKKAQMEGASFFTRPCAHSSHTYIAYFVSPFPPTRMYSPCCPDVHTVLLYWLISHGLVVLSAWWWFVFMWYMLWLFVCIMSTTCCLSELAWS